MARVEKFEDLKIWQEARELVRRIYKLNQHHKDFGFRDQIQRTSVSVMNNVAEGFERSSDTEFNRFLDIAKASCEEVRSMLYLAEDLEYLSKNEAEELRNRCFYLSGSIFNLMKHLKKQSVI